MKKTHLLALLLIAFSFAIQAQNKQFRQQEIIKKLQRSLVDAKSPADSLRIYYDIIDLAPRGQYLNVIRQMYGVADRLGDNSAKLDICRLATSAISDDARFVQLEQEVASLPQSDEQLETELFIKMKRISYKSRNLSETDRQKEITRLIALQESGDSLNRYDRLLNLYSIVAYLRTDATGDMLKTYLNRLFEMIRKSGFSLYAIPNIVYAESANIYADAGDHQKAIEADRKLLKVIDELEKSYTAKGRKYRNYDISRYVSYRRMLRSYTALAQGEAEQLYAKMKALADQNPDVNADFTTNPRVPAYYYMATGQYAKAIPTLKQTIGNESGLALRRQTVEELIRASELTGDSVSRLYALEQYKAIREEYKKLNAAERYKELQIKYDIKDLKERNAALELENQTEQIRANRRAMTMLTVGFVILAVILIIAIYQWARYRKSATRMGEIVDKMALERNELHNELYDYDEAANQPKPFPSCLEWKKQKRKLRKESLNISTWMAQHMINSLLYIAMLGRDDRLKHIHDVSVDNVMRVATTRAEQRVNGKADFSVSYPEDDFKITTDRECLTEILGHTLANTSSLNRDGSEVKLECRKANDAVRFIFTSGRKFSPADVSEIFSTIISARDMAERKDNGMFIDRMIALLLQSSLLHDRTFEHGTRFILVVPNILK